MSDYQGEHPEETEAAVRAIQDLAAKRAWLAAEVPGIDYSTASAEAVERVYSVFQAGKAESYRCGICNGTFTLAEWLDRHDSTDAWDVHARCCPDCPQETEDEREARLDDEAAPWRVVSLYAGLGTTVVTFRCEDPTGADRLVAVEHRPAQDILEALSDPEQPPVYIERPPSFQILR